MGSNTQIKFTCTKISWLISKNQQLFWDINDTDLSFLNNEAIIERLMAYGDMDDIHELEKIFTPKKLQKVFKKDKN